jgi:hypothetical protein
VLDGIQGKQEKRDHVNGIIERYVDRYVHFTLYSINPLLNAH